MPYLLGTDEAGYGPNLGPLVVAASLWHVEGELSDELDLFARLADVVTARRSGATDRRLLLADSKQLYQSGGGWRELEAGLWPLLGLLGHAPRCASEIWRALADISAEDSGAPQTPAWHREIDASLPRDADAAELGRSLERTRDGLTRSGVRLCAIRCRAIFPGEFNAVVAELGNKSTALSHFTLQLTADLLRPCAAEPVAIVCDKHGGRNRYAALLQRFFPEEFIEVVCEGRDVSRYAWGPKASRARIDFQVGGESWLPSAVASMAAKYLRELAMLAFNEFWMRELPGLRPTAGYPVDAKRFHAEIAPRQRELGIADAHLWRVK